MLMALINCDKILSVRVCVFILTQLTLNGQLSYIKFRHCDAIDTLSAVSVRMCDKKSAAFSLI